jgi:hypothetical protein
MAEVLTPGEIDRLLSAINQGDTETEDFFIPSFDDIRPHDFVVNRNTFKNIEDFETFLTKRKFEPDKIYGNHSSNKEITMCRFFASKENEKILADIEQKNKEQNMGNIIIPNTNIKLINYSICPKCNTVFSFKDLMDYYKNPIPDSEYKNRGTQIREDTRICCYECSEYFLPALVISDGTPKNEVQFLCKMQTVHEIESFFLRKGKNVLSRNKANVVIKNNFLTVRNDVEIKQMELKPTLISNMLQYTPINLIPNLIDGSNVEKGDILFGKWNPIPS